MSFISYAALSRATPHPSPAKTMPKPEPDDAATTAERLITEADADVAASAAALPLDARLLRGTLANGLEYYVRPNAKPSRVVEFRLVVNVGSVAERDDERGVAHFVEHML